MIEFPLPMRGFFGTADRVLWHAPSCTAVLADVHLGAEASLAKQGIFLPDRSGAAILAAWKRLAAMKPARVIIAGDLFDSPAPGGAELELFQTMLALLPPHCPVTLTPGNHDPDARALAPLFPKVEIPMAAELAGVAVFHGHDSGHARGVGKGHWAGPADDPQRFWLPAGIIVGHQHPAVTLATRVQRVKMICFVTGVLRQAGGVVPLVILPAFSPLPLGSNLLNGEQWILDLPAPARKEMRIAGIIERAKGAAQVLDFGPLSGLG